MKIIITRCQRWASTHLAKNTLNENFPLENHQIESGQYQLRMGKIKIMKMEIIFQKLKQTQESHNIIMTYYYSWRLNKSKDFWMNWTQKVKKDILLPFSPHQSKSIFLSHYLPTSEQYCFQYSWGLEALEMQICTPTNTADYILWNPSKHQNILNKVQKTCL